MATASSRETAAAAVPLADDGDGSSSDDMSDGPSPLTLRGTVPNTTSCALGLDTDLSPEVLHTKTRQAMQPWKKLMDGRNLESVFNSDVLGSSNWGLELKR